MNKGMVKESRWHSIYENCEFYRIPCEKGRKRFKTISIYRGLLYEANQTKQERFFYCLRFSGALTMAVLLFLLCCVYPAGVNYSRYIGFVQSITAVIYLYAAVVWLLYLTAEKRMRACIYRMTSQKLIRSCKASAVLSAICAVAVLCCPVLGNVAMGKETLFIAAGFSICAILMSWLFKMEEDVLYLVNPSGEEPPNGAEKLDYITNN